MPRPSFTEFDANFTEFDVTHIADYLASLNMDHLMCVRKVGAMSSYAWMSGGERWLLVHRAGFASIQDKLFQKRAPMLQFTAVDTDNSLQHTLYIVPEFVNSVDKAPEYNGLTKITMGAQVSFFVTEPYADVLAALAA